MQTKGAGYQTHSLGGGGHGGPSLPCGIQQSPQWVTHALPLVPHMGGAQDAAPHMADTRCTSLWGAIPDRSSRPHFDSFTSASAVGSLGTEYSTAPTFNTTASACIERVISGRSAGDELSKSSKGERTYVCRNIAIVSPASASRCAQASSPVYTAPPAPANAFDRSVSFGLRVGSKTMRIGLNPLSTTSCGKSNSSCQRPWPEAAMVTRSLISYASRSFMQSTCLPWLGRLRLLIGLCEHSQKHRRLRWR